MSELAHSPNSTIDRSRLDAVLEPIARTHGAEVVDLEFKSEPSGWVLRIFVEKLGSADTNASTEQAAVDLEMCAKVAHDLSPVLDAADIIPHRYHLEISSPGVERPLRGPRDFTRFAGKKAKLKLRTAVGGQKVVVGTLGEVMPEYVVLKESTKNHEVRFENIIAARLVFEFGPAPKPGKKKK